MSTEREGYDLAMTSADVFTQLQDTMVAHWWRWFS